MSRALTELANRLVELGIQRVEPHWIWWRLVLLDFGQVLVVPPGIVERSFELGRGQVTEVAVQSAGVVPVHPSQSGQLEVLDGLPRAAAGRSVDEFGLVEAVDRLGEGVDAPISVKRRIQRPVGPRAGAASGTRFRGRGVV